MTSAIDDAIDWGMPPAGLDTIAADLRALRAAAGEPSYTEIGRRIAQQRAARGVPHHERRMPRSTLYDCFRDGRRRMSSDTVTEIALALGLPAQLRSRGFSSSTSRLKGEARGGSCSRTGSVAGSPATSMPW